jgi:hypothetical protein
VSKPTYVPNCTYRGCLRHVRVKGEKEPVAKVNTATQYVYMSGQTWHVCAGCAKKLAIKYGLEAKATRRAKVQPAPGLFS